MKFSSDETAETVSNQMNKSSKPRKTGGRSLQTNSKQLQFWLWIIWIQSNLQNSIVLPLSYFSRTLLFFFFFGFLDIVSNIVEFLKVGFNWGKVCVQMRECERSRNGWISVNVWGEGIFYNRFCIVVLLFPFLLAPLTFCFYFFAPSNSDLFYLLIGW